MSTSRAEVIACLRDVPGGLTARELATIMRIPWYQASATLSKLVAYQKIRGVRDLTVRNHATRYFAKVQP